MARFRVFTAEQLAEMFFDTLKRGQVRLHRLHQLGVLDRFQPYRAGWGSSPYHYVLGPLGAEMAAAQGGGDVKAVRRRANVAGLSLGRPSSLARLRLTNGFYAALVGHARHRPDAELVDWMTADEARQWSEGIVEPAAFGEWSEAGRTVEFFVEGDAHGPVQAVMSEILERHARFTRERGRATWILFVASTTRRRAAARLTSEAAHEAMVVVTDDGPSELVGAVRSRRDHPPMIEVPEARRAWLFDRRRERLGGRT